MSQSTIFRGTFLFSGGHYRYIFFYSNFPSVVLSTNAMFKSELNIQLLSRGPLACATSSQNNFVSLIFGKGNRTLYPLGDQTSAICTSKS